MPRTSRTSFLLRKVQARQLIAVPLLFLFTVVQLGLPVWLHVQRAAVKIDAVERIAQGVEQADLTIFTMTPREWEVLERSWGTCEITSKDGRLYDVVSHTTIDGMVRAYALCDDQETGLLASIDAFIVHLFGELPAGSSNSEEESSLVAVHTMPLPLEPMLGDVSPFRFGIEQRVVPIEGACVVPSPPPKG
ncbi:MAG TPA: hypothetical protein PK760_03015 [Flavobacteriales bacterium]|nr:hypothetical protein [Flavobacteriales bacterium]